MKTNGIVAEYNPFHNGHKYHLETSKKRTCADYTIIAMSGNFMQRGTPAMIHKYARAKMALENGADLVLEIPSFYACGSAEYYAKGAITLLEQLGVTDYLCFGSECGDADVLTEAARTLLEEPDEYLCDLTDGLKLGHSYPAARSMALRSYFAQKAKMTDAFSSPNNILGVEYIKALIQLNSQIKPVTIKREGAGYHEQSFGEYYPSATAVRHAIHTIQNSQRKSSTDWMNLLSNQLPDSTLSILQNTCQALQPIDIDDFSQVLLYKLLEEEPSGYEKYLDVSSDLSDKIRKNLFHFHNVSSFCDLLKSKDTTYTRLSRSLMHILLNIKKDDMMHYRSLNFVPYARVLGLRKDAAPLLSAIKKHSSIPLITKLADAENILDGNALKMLQKDIQISHVYNGVEAVKCGTEIRNEYRAGIVVI